MSKIITLLTDFGLKDNYVASMKGSILAICREATIVDITHLIDPQDIMEGGFLLNASFRDFPPGTIHVAVVDPGVGTQRQGLAVKTQDHIFIGPDNGIFSFILARSKGWEARTLKNKELWRRTISSTFHGRDIFATTAAHLARGVPFEEVGPPCNPLIQSWAIVLKEENLLRGNMVHIDHFGNLISNIPEEMVLQLAPLCDCSVRVGSLRDIPIRETYADVPPGSFLALIGSSGYLEIAVNQGSAARLGRIRKGAEIQVHRSS